MSAVKGLQMVTLMAALSVIAVPAAPEGLVAQQPVFRSAVDLVAVTATVRDRRGRIITDLSREDFEIYDAGTVRPIVEFHAADAGPVSLALLLDVSGSMRLSSNLVNGRDFLHHLVSWFEGGRDEAALFAFDRDLREIVPFTTDHGQLRAALETVEPYGVTSLYDAIAQTAERIAAEPVRRRAIVVLTDGVDTASRLTAPEVSGIAGSIAVPVYVVALLSPLDDPGGSGSIVGSIETEVTTNLTNLAYWTGGELFTVSTSVQASLAVRRLLTGLRHQYLLAFEATGDSGWRRLDVRTRRNEFVVSARGGYFAG